jgi:hypothetical protein
MPFGASPGRQQAAEDRPAAEGGAGKSGKRSVKHARK